MIDTTTLEIKENNYLDKIDLVLIMSVEPGLGGQSFIENSYETSQYKKKYSDAIEKAIVQIKDGGEYEI